MPSKLTRNKNIWHRHSRTHSGPPRNFVRMSCSSGIVTSVISPSPNGACRYVGAPLYFISRQNIARKYFIHSNRYSYCWQCCSTAFYSWFPSLHLSDPVNSKCMPLLLRLPTCERPASYPSTLNIRSAHYLVNHSSFVLSKPIQVFKIHSISYFWSHANSASHLSFLFLSILVTPHLHLRHFLPISSSSRIFSSLIPEVSAPLYVMVVMTTLSCGSTFMPEHTHVTLHIFFVAPKVFSQTSFLTGTVSNFLDKITIYTISPLISSPAYSYFLCSFSISCFCIPFQTLL